MLPMQPQPEQLKPPTMVLENQPLAHLRAVHRNLMLIEPKPPQLVQPAVAADS
jgi:hypothetical protein